MTWQWVAFLAVTLSFIAFESWVSARYPKEPRE